MNIQTELHVRINQVFHELVTGLLHECDYQGPSVSTQVIMQLVEKSLNNMKLIIDEFNSLVKR